MDLENISETHLILFPRIYINLILVLRNCQALQNSQMYIFENQIGRNAVKYTAFLLETVDS